MKGARVIRANTRSLTSYFATISGAAAIALVATGPALAISSPELVVGSFVSLSQLFALATAIFGGGAAFATVRARRNGSKGMSRGVTTAAIVTFVLLIASICVNVFQYFDSKKEHQARLESTLLRPTRASQSLPEDPDKDLNFAQQGKHPLGMSTDEAVKLLKAQNRGETDKYVFIDIREPAEQVIGSLRGATMVRFPDLKIANLDLTGKKVILFCHNGNRSSAAAEAMVKMGIDAAFVVGGLEKLVVEGRETTGISVRNIAELRSIPNYTNRNTLLDTAQVKGLIDKDRAIFVDIRSSTDFSASHIPGAINLNFSRMTTGVMSEQIAQLPKRPIILPCYDRHGCFFADIAGYELSRAGHDVRGRYTLPWEYFVSRGRPPYVEAWLAEQNKNTAAKMADYLAGLMFLVSQWTGVVAAILLLAALSRLLVLPFSLKAERDQLRARCSADEMAQLKSRLKDDPVRRTRAIRGFYKRHGMTPGRNLLALAFLPVMAVALLAVQELAIRSNSKFLWIDHLALRDPLYVLPAVFGVLITLYVDIAFATKAKHRVFIWLTVLPAMVAVGLTFGAASNIYLIGSAVLLLTQRLWVDGKFAAAVRAWRRRALPNGVIPLEAVSELADKGNKAYRLSQMRAAGMPVPNGLLLSPAFLEMFAKGSAETRHSDLERIWNWLGCERLAVRSSAKGEDRSDQSFAGVFASVVNVDRTEFKSAIAKVQASFSAVRAGAYLGEAGDGSVLVQRMVHAEYAGVMFTRDPSAGGLTMIEVVEGTAENLVSGVVRPQTCRFGRITKKPFGKAQAAIDLLPLLHLGDKAERLFGGPQDIEWAYRDGKFHLVQSRDITRKTIGDADAIVIHDDFARAVDLARGAASDEIVFGRNELSEMLPRPTPISLSLMESLWMSGGSVDLAARELGLPYRVEEGSVLLTTVMGCLYINKREEKSRALVVRPLAVRRLLRVADRIERNFRESFLPQFLSDIRLLEVADFEELSTDELVAEVARLRDRFVLDTHVSVDIVNIAARVYLDHARRALEAAGIEPSSLLGHIPETFENHAITEISATQSASRRWLLLKNFGHRALLDYELAEPRYAEDANQLNRMFAGREHAKRQGHHQTAALGRSLDRSVDIARRFQTLKEDAKHHSLRAVAVLRRVLLTIDRRFDLEGDVFYLTFDEVQALNGNNLALLRETAAKRRDQALRLRKAVALPSTLTAHDLEAASAGDRSEMHALPNIIRGTRVAGSKVVEGRARVISAENAEFGNPTKAFRDGDIVVAAMINPAWLPYFSRAGGFVSEVGGWLSHPAILAREYDVAMVVGTAGIGRIVDGTMLRIHLDGKIEIVQEDESVFAA